MRQKQLIDKNVLKPTENELKMNLPIKALMTLMKVSLCMEGR